MNSFLIRWIINTVGIVIVAHLMPGIDVDGLLPAVVAGLVLGVMNAIVRPVLVILTLPITLLTLGLFLLVINGLMLSLVAALVEGFHVAGFWSAFFGALLLSLIGWATSSLVYERDAIPG
jgi:putative membrane protein